MAKDTRYIIGIGAGTKDTDSVEPEMVPCWNVSRVTGGMGWHIGRYDSPETAQKVVDFLTGLVPHELD